MGRAVRGIRASWPATLASSRCCSAGRPWSPVSLGLLPGLLHRWRSGAACPLATRSSPPTWWAAAIAQVAPTPGGIGAVEAALIAGLTAAGLDKETAVPAVFLFRLVTFWLPILPGWLAFTWLQRTDQI